jgi:hypothetical protein
MANISGVVGSVDLRKRSYKKFLAMGEGATSDDFRMTVEGYSDLEYLIQATQLPPLAREVIEGYGPHGVQFVQAGRLKNIAEVPVTFKEVISGKVYTAIRDWVKNKKYLTVQLSLMGESSAKGLSQTSITLEDCWLELEGVDLSVEDNTLLKPSGTLHANWISWGDGDQTSLDWE